MDEEKPPGYTHSSDSHVSHSDIGVGVVHEMSREHAISRKALRERGAISSNQRAGRCFGGDPMQSKDKAGELSLKTQPFLSAQVQKNRSML